MSNPHTAEPDPDSDRLRFEIRGGAPTADEVAALTTAVMGLAGASTQAPATAGPAWSRAARLEATGQAPFTSATDPRLGLRPPRSLPPDAT